MRIDRQTDQPTDRQTFRTTDQEKDRTTHTETYGAALAAKNSLNKIKLINSGIWDPTYRATPHFWVMNLERLRVWVTRIISTLRFWVTTIERDFEFLSLSAMKKILNILGQ